MSSIIIRGKKYDANELSTEAVAFTTDLAKKARIDNPLPADTDFTELEDKDVQSQLRAMVALPPEVVGLMWAAFCAKHLGKTAAILRSLSLQNQPKAFATYVQIISLLPEPKYEPYWRMFLRSSDSDRIANIVGNAFAQGVEWRRPSGPGFICSAIIELLFWCNTAQGDDHKASIDADVRKAIARKTRAFKSSNTLQQLDRRQQIEIERLDGILNAVERMPEDTYLVSTKDSLVSEMDDQCGNEDCDEMPTMRCAKCKSVQYCGRQCQSKHWKKEHKVRCFEKSS